MSKFDIHEILKPLLREGWKIDNTGRYCPPEYTLDPNKPFVSSNLNENGYRCSWERDALFTILYRGRAVPTRCHRCYKVVLAPSKLPDVWKIETFQRENKYPAKVGMEIRPTVKRAWGAYWYTNSLEEGKERYAFVKSWAEKNLDYDYTLILKHGCTEFEQAVGRSDEWEIGDWQWEFEKQINEHVLPMDPTPVQPESLKAHIRRQWERWEQLMRPVVTYHDEEGENGDTEEG